MTPAVTEPALSPTQPPDAADRLAQVLLDGCMGRPLRSLLPPGLCAELGRAGVLSLLRDPQADARLAQGLALLEAALRRVPTLRALLPADAILLLQELCRAPYAPDRMLLVALLSRPPFRRLNRELMMGTLVEYTRRIRSTLSDPNAGRNMGMLGRLATQAVQRGTAAVGAVASGMASVVTDELERQMQRRAGEFADSAVDELVGRLATMLTEPSRTAEHTELKLALLDFTLDLRGDTLAAELTRAQPLRLAAQLRSTLRAWLERPQAGADLTAALTWIYAQDFAGKPWGDRTLRDLLVALSAPSTGPAATSDASAPLSATGQVLYSALATAVAHWLRPSVDSGAALAALRPAAPATV